MERNQPPFAFQAVCKLRKIRNRAAAELESKVTDNLKSGVLGHSSRKCSLLSTFVHERPSLKREARQCAALQWYAVLFAFVCWSSVTAQG